MSAASPMLTSPVGAVTPHSRPDGGSMIKLAEHRDGGSTSTSPSVPLLPKLGPSMNYQRPLAPDSSTSASSHGDMELKPTMAMGPLPQRKKKPGPKRDSKPAPSEKLERNRQAQRTHRERKEQYTKDLELELMRLKELFSSASRERDSASQARDQAVRERDQLRSENERLQEENQKMRLVIQSSSSSTDSGYDTMSATCGPTRTNSLTNTEGYLGLTAPMPMEQDPIARTPNVWEQYETRGFASDGALVEPSPTGIKIEHVSPPHHVSPQQAGSSLQTALVRQPTPLAMDYDEIGLDFVLTLERPCMGHIQYLHVRAHNYQFSADGEMMGKPMEVPDDGENQHISGHALMATAPPYSQIMNNPNSRYPTQFPQDVRREDLVKLLDLSSQLQITETELPPVKAWIKIMRDGRLGLLSVNDLTLLKQRLAAKVQCYRFGAIVGDDDINEAIQYVLDCKTNAGPVLLESPSTRNWTPASH